MSEPEFWTKFFQSHYFHRDRINAGTKDLFTECAKIDDKELEKDIQCGINDPLVDITSFVDKTIDAGYGCSNGDADKSSGNNVHQNMIKRFNQHSIMVMKASTIKQQQKDTNKIDSTMNNSKNQQQLNGVHSSDNHEPNAKKLRIQEKLVYDDLESSNNVDVSVGLPLKLDHVDRYLHGPVPGTGSIEATSEELQVTLGQLRREAAGWINGNNLPRQSATSLVSPKTAVGVLGELTPGGTLMKGFREDHVGREFNDNI